MNKRFFRLSIHGMHHRKKEISGPGIACILAIFFITGVLLFQENMYQWQMAENYLKFGEWFVMERRQKPSETLTESPYLNAPARGGNFARIYNINWTKTWSYVGYLSEEFIEQGNLKIMMGRLPEADDEIACDWNTLTQLGSNGVLGESITIHYFLNDNRSNINPEREATYKLVGVLADYTDVWQYGRLIPGALITESACAALDAKETPIYSYALKENVRAADYQELYKEITKHTSGGKIYYNESVYNFKAWGPEQIYNYIYLLVVVIGIAALAYQVIGYQHSRDTYYRRLRLMGATKGLIRQSRFIENIWILLPSGILGMLASLLTGYIIGRILEIEKEIAFFKINPLLLLKSAAAIMIALIMAEAVNLFMTLRHGNTWTIQQKKRKHHMKQVRAGRCRLTKKNLTWQMHVRMSRNSGMGQRLGTRIFALCICAVMVFCMWNTYTAFAQYARYSYMPDMVGFQQNLDAEEVPYELPLAVQYSPKERHEQQISTDKEGDIAYRLEHHIPLVEKEEWVTGMLDIYHYWMTSYERFKLPVSFVESSLISSEYEQGLKDYEWREEGLRTEQTTLTVGSDWCKLGNTNLFSGMEEGLKQKIEQTRGVESVTYNSFESVRIWTWDDMDYAKMGMQKMAASSGTKMSNFSDRYLFATSYIEPTREAYELLSQYMDPSMVDYEAFCRGEQVLVLLQNTPRVKNDVIMVDAYDDTITAGTKLSYHYYDLPVTAKDLIDYSTEEESLYPYWDQFRTLMDKRLYKEADDDYKVTACTEFGESREYYELLYQMQYEACAEPTVAGVVRVTDEVKQELADFVSDYGYYTAIAAKSLGEQACAEQKKLMEAFLGEPLPENISCEMMGNQMTVHFNLSASYSATENILSTYCKSNDVIFVSNSDIKEQYRTNALDAVLQYGTTMIAAAVVDILICVVLTKSRIEARQRKLKLLLQMGANKGRVRRICMLEVLRESLWCIFTLPIQLLVQYIIYRRAVENIK